MSKSPGGSGRATAEDLHHVLGAMDDATTIAILALQPTLSQLEEARLWLDGADDIVGEQRHPLDGVVAQIFDLLDVDEEEARR